MEKYNGWTNKATWLVSTWLDEESTYNYIRGIAEDKTAFELSEWLKKYLEDNTPLNEASLYNDLLAWSIELCNYEEVAESIKRE